MTNLPAWVSRVAAIWLALGTFLTILAFQGVQIPGFLTDIFTQATWDLILKTVTAVFTFYQGIKAIFIVSPAPAGVQVRTLSATEVNDYAFNPFRIRRP